MRTIQGIHNMTASLTSRLKKYATIAVAGAATTTAAVQNADADILYSGILNIAVPADFTGVYLDIDGLAFNTTGADADSDYNIWFSGGQWDTFHPNGGTTTDQVNVDGFVDNLSFGDAVDGGTNTTLANITDAGGTAPFNTTNTGYIGVNVNGNLGWIQLADVDADAGTLTVVDWAFEDSGGPITAGQTSSVPEPGSLAVLGLGGLVFLTRRRRNG